MIRSKQHRWNNALPGQLGAEPTFGARRSAPREIPPEHDLVSRLLAEDARGQRREGWLGLGLAAAVLTLFASGAGVPLLALAFCAAPLIGIGLEIFAPSDRRQG